MCSEFVKTRAHQGALIPWALRWRLGDLIFQQWPPHHPINRAPCTILLHKASSGHDLEGGLYNLGTTAPLLSMLGTLAQ